MACSITINGRAFPCKTGIGGIKQVWIAEWTDGMWDAVSSGSIPDASSAVTFYGFELTKNSGSLQQTINSSMENGTIFFSQVVTAVLPILTAADNAELYDLMKSRVSIIVEDNNGNKLVMGHTQGVEISGGEIGTGTAKGDLNGYNLQFTAEEAIPAPHLGAAASVTFTAGS